MLPNSACLPYGTLGLGAYHPTEQNMPAMPPYMPAMPAIPWCGTFTYYLEAREV